MAMICLLLLCTWACQTDPKQDIPDVSGIEVRLDLKRFETDLLRLDTSTLEAGLEGLRARYPDFLDCYVQNILGYPSDKGDGAGSALWFALRHKGFRAAIDSVLDEFPDLRQLESQLTEAFRFVKHYYPADSLPAIVTFTSEFAYGIVLCDDHLIGIGLDLFLGPRYAPYSSLEVNIPEYLLHTRDKESIVPGVIRLMAENQHPPAGMPANLLDQMIRNGKYLHWMDQMLPGVSDHLKIGYTRGQQEWCDKHEGEIWALLKGEGWLYKPSYSEYFKFVTDGPSTPGLPAQAPGNIGTWVGWQIVKAYARKSGAGILELMQAGDAQEILEQSGYKPRPGVFALVNI